MGHTVRSQRQVIDTILNELEAYGKALRKEDRELYEEMLKEAMKHFGTIAFANSMHVWAFVLLSIMLEREKRLRKKYKLEN